MNTIDMRSDTVTQPTGEMRLAMANAQVGDAVYGDDPTTNELEAYAASLVGKEAALFVPSGVFGNQLAIFTHCRPGEEVILYEDCHIVEHEAGSAAAIAGVQLRTLCSPGSNPNANEIQARIRVGYQDDVHKPKSALICLENAHSDGKVVPLEAMEQVYNVAHQHGIPLHLDGARLFNAAAYLGVDAAQIARYANSVMFCLSKGLCAPVGSILAGSKEFIAAARRKRKVLGGGMRQTGILAAAGLIALKEMVNRLPEDHANAQKLAAALKEIPGIKIQPEETHINLVFFEVNQQNGQRIEQAFAQNNILANPPENGKMRLATHNGITEKDIDFVAQVLRGAVQ